MTSRSTLGVRRRLVLAVAGGAVSLALVLTGCAGRASPGPSGSGAASASESATPTPSYVAADQNSRARDVLRPSLPKAAQEKTKEGLQEFAAYYVELLEYAYRSGQTDDLSGVNSESCSSCTGPVGDVQHAYANGGWIVGGDLETTAGVTSFLPTSNDSYFVNLSIRQSETSYFDGPSKLRSRVPAPGKDAPMQMTAVFVQGAWQVEDFSPPKTVSG